ncbi:MAG: restriction endonuclease, partial [Chloroflexi bacterium]|nr:restriction endonuclease [Chloroflexota bacterium]
MCLCLEEEIVAPPPYSMHLKSASDLVTTYEATRAGFVSLALEKNRQATPHVQEARAFYEAASHAKTLSDLLGIKGIKAALTTAAGLSEKALRHLTEEDRLEAVQGLIKNFLEPAGAKWLEELVFRFLLVHGDALGGSMRNVGGVLAQRKLVRTVISALTISGTKYQWLHNKARKWVKGSNEDSDIELSLRGLSWESNSGDTRTIIFNLGVPLVKHNVDLCLFNLTPDELKKIKLIHPKSYLALGELKGGIDPAGADEHWKTARTALERIWHGFNQVQLTPATLFVGAAIEKTMA